MVLLGIKLSVFECLVRDKCTPGLTVGLIKCLNSGHIIILQVQKACQAELADHATHFSSSVQLLSSVQLFVTSWTSAHQASLSITSSQSLLKLMSIESVMPSNHLILCHPLLLPPSIFPSIRVFSSESALCIRWPKYWSFSFSINPSNDWSPLGWTGLISVQSKGVSRAFSNTTVQKYQFFGPQPSLWSNSHIHTRLLEKP